ncbi:hypothetical protein K504DRAFT_378827 [Pleomassaria siparia CBS 279.74]|uniref:Membrane-associated proteins in eicosanoid and glutathione metabolism n=1 Tax=Pleomassaria siparia CBS 279.74 TaxID=1314801 RepID=A0A6G1KAQ4_9PLEO|nr:hypothetical protein K504DRAFT_378827 [Pleomassaria siparia CBS 279.74]
MAPNLSIYAIPVYWVMALFPHFLAVCTAANVKWDASNPRGSNNQSTIQKSAPKHVYARFERAEAAHKNLLESAPLFIGAVVVGNTAKLEASTLNNAVGAYLALRALYIAVYLNTTTGKYSFFRSATWATSIGVLFTILIKAGNKLY